MKWKDNGPSGDVEDRRGARGGTAAKVGGGGAIIAIVIAIISQVVSGGGGSAGSAGGGGGGIDLSSIANAIGGASKNGGDSSPTGGKIDPASDPDRALVAFIDFSMKDIQDTFAKVVRGYRRAKLVIFTSAIDTGCGASSAAIGPFYCPPDEKAYIDLSFYRELKERFGAPGDFAQAYVLAHEIGHHVQHLLGVDEKVRRASRADKARENDLSVRTELQADCYAGVWGHAAAARDLLDAGDVQEALEAATAIGDDRLQKQAGARVNPETWTHGSSAQRVKWFRIGMDSGSIDSCDTFTIARP